MSVSPQDVVFLKTIGSPQEIWGNDAEVIRYMLQSTSAIDDGLGIRITSLAPLSRPSHSPTFTHIARPLLGNEDYTSCPLGLAEE